MNRLPTSSGVTWVSDLTLPTLDVRSEAYRHDPYPLLRNLADSAPMARSHRGIEVLSYPLAEQILGADSMETPKLDHFRNYGAPEVLLEFVADGLLLNMPRERHDPVRRILARAFARRKVEEQRSLVAELLDELVTPLISRGECDLVADFTRAYPMMVLCRFIGVPLDDVSSFAQSALDLELLGASPLKPAFPRLAVALTELQDYVRGLVDLRLRDPQADFISALLTEQLSEGLLTESEIVWGVVNLLFAGQDSTRYQMASVVRATVESNQWETLYRDPTLISPALDEALRMHPVLQFLVRKPAEDTVIDGYGFKAGEQIILNMLAASRDPQIFTEPDRFDPTRDTRYNLLFGKGLHFCLGRQLAMTEMQLALTVLVERITDVTLNQPVRTSGWQPMIGGPESLHLAFSVR